MERDMTIERKILLNPGPATTTGTVKAAMVVPDICPREKEFQAVMAGVGRDLVTIVNGGDDFTCVLLCGSGTAAMDACINSVVPPGKTVAIVNNGAYGRRLVDIARAYGISVAEIQCDWDRAPDPARIEAVLAGDESIAALAVVHHETTTGLLNPVAEMGRMARKYDCLYIVDAISSFAGIPIDINALGIDFLMSTSNKCIQGMAGLAFVICRTEALKRAGAYPRRSFYLNLFDQYDGFQRNGQMRFTPPVQVVYALRQAIDEYFAEGDGTRYQRYTRNWQALRQGLADLGFCFLLDPANESHILTTVMEPADPNFSFQRLHDLLYAKGITIYPGKIGGRHTFRVANMGAIDTDDIQTFLDECRTALDAMGVRRGA